MGKFSVLFKKYRQRSNLRYVDIARLLSVSAPYIQQFEDEKNKPPVFEKCQKIAEIFKLNTEEKYEFYRAAYLERVKPEDRKYIHELEEFAKKFRPF